MMEYVQKLSFETAQGKQTTDDHFLKTEFATEDLVMADKFGVTNSQTIPDIKQVIADDSVEEVRMLRSMYLYTIMIKALGRYWWMKQSVQFTERL
ncbi:hypothetical protein J2T13_002571 [Paenibacillus sp. DS2015]|uniref:hypothetical protein n=1 Tax=Paenibacillus sp. DS2015 TaxID=3373917 RepID=UPI003D1C339B